MGGLSEEGILQAMKRTSVLEVAAVPNGRSVLNDGWTGGKERRDDEGMDYAVPAGQLGFSMMASVRWRMRWRGLLF